MYEQKRWLPRGLTGDKTEVHKQDVEYTECRCRSAELINFGCGVSVQGLEPEEMTTVGSRTRIPENDISEGEDIDRPFCENVA